MPRIATDGKYTIRVYARNEHPPPHVHVFYDGKVSRVSLFDLRVMDKVSKQVEKALKIVVKKYRRHALDVWAELNERSEK
jgi:hypothetical protein